MLQGMQLILMHECDPGRRSCNAAMLIENGHQLLGVKAVLWAGGWLGSEERSVHHHRWQFYPAGDFDHVLKVLDS